MATGKTTNRAVVTGAEESECYRNTFSGPIDKCAEELPSFYVDGVIKYFV